MKSLLILTLFTLLIFSCSTGTEPEKEEKETTDPWVLVWQDEFNDQDIDVSKWNFHMGTGEGGWGNNELQYYTDRSSNTYLQDGALVIQALKESYRGSDYTSARINTLGKGDWLYGRFEVRAKMPEGQGLWPAIWMLPSAWLYGGWAASGEIDIIELIGSDINTVHGTIHYGGQFPDNVQSGAAYHSPLLSFSEVYHTFAIEWDSTSIKWFVDDSLYQTQSFWYSANGPYPAPFNQKFHLLLNVAVGGNWPGRPNSETSFPQRMFIDYVRVYQKNPDFIRR